LLSSAEWDGVSVLELLEDLDVRTESTRVLVSGFDQYSEPSANDHSTPGASWIFGWDDLEQTGAFLATRMNGEPLPKDHGAPVRLYVPGWYGCTAIKWVTEIRIVPDDAPPTSQMIEFAGRTHQPGTPGLARDFIPASMDTAAMPTLVERSSTRTGDVAYRVLGIVWGGDGTKVELEIRFGDGPYEPVQSCSFHRAAPFGLWQHLWQPSGPGQYPIVLRVSDPAVRTRRLDSGFYERVVRI
jgi:DMSO/TMAO reductase YedYZ molybdopterin-dependent catalytic subunit